MGKAVQPESSQQLVAYRVKTLGKGELVESVPLSVGAWLQAKRLPQRVELEAVVVEQHVDKGLRYLPHALRQSTFHGYRERVVQAARFVSSR